VPHRPLRPAVAFREFLHDCVGREYGVQRGIESLNAKDRSGLVVGEEQSGSEEEQEEVFHGVCARKELEREGAYAWQIVEIDSAADLFLFRFLIIFLRQRGKRGRLRGSGRGRRQGNERRRRKVFQQALSAGWRAR
jgi:hypothetical protein